jgi:type IV pilus assembly protein PilM
VAFDFSFFKKLRLPGISLGEFRASSSKSVGIDIGIYSTKIVQLRYEAERAVLETYGEILNAGYFKNAEGGGFGFLRYREEEVAEMLKDLLRESNVTTKDAVFSIPASASFVTLISFPHVPKKEIDQAVPYEARKYIPIPLAEVILDWQVLETESETGEIDVLLVAVPREVFDKVNRIAKTAEVRMASAEVETFSKVRSLIGRDLIPTAVVNIGYQATTLAVADKAVLRFSYLIDHGSHELTRAVERGLALNSDRAEAVKREAGLSERIEEREITSVIEPLVERLIAEIGRLVSLYNRKAPRKVQRIILAGGGSKLKGLVERLASRIGLEVTRGNPFARLITPAVMQPILRDIGPAFSVAAGLALREMTGR